MSIRVLFVVMALSGVALIGVAVTVFVRVRGQWKSQRAGIVRPEEMAGKSGEESMPPAPRR
ncbi:MAG: hypothetical protein WA532_04400 [Candidatus Korobacteraceae bacterium]